MDLTPELDQLETLDEALWNAYHEASRVVRFHENGGEVPEELLDMAYTYVDGVNPNYIDWLRGIIRANKYTELFRAFLNPT